MRETIIYNSIFIHFFRIVGFLVLKVKGYKIIGELPADKKIMAIVAPHTSNWDFVLLISMVFVKRISPRFMGKHTLFKGVLGRFMYWCGGFPVKREGPQANDAIGTAVELYQNHDELLFGMAPEGTRRKVDKWKTGFWRIAKKANVPIMLVYIDGNKKEIGIRDTLFYPSEDMDKDILEIQDYYKDKPGVNPVNHLLYEAN